MMHPPDPPPLALKTQRGAARSNHGGGVLVKSSRDIEHL